MSLQKLTMYYCALNRLGSLLPIVFSPVRNIELNFYLQVFCRALSAAATPAFLILILLPRIATVLSFGAVAGVYVCVHASRYLISVLVGWEPLRPIAVAGMAVRNCLLQARATLL